MDQPQIEDSALHSSITEWYLHLIEANHSRYSFYIHCSKDYVHGIAHSILQQKHDFECSRPRYRKGCFWDIFTGALRGCSLEQGSPLGSSGGFF